LRRMEDWAEAGAAKDAERHSAAAIATDFLRRIMNPFEKLEVLPLRPTYKMRWIPQYRA